MALVILTFSFAYTYAEDAANPVLDFVGQDTGVNLENESTNTYTESEGGGEGIISSIVNAISNITSAAIDGLTSFFDTEEISEMTLKCIPQEADKDEKILLIYKCEKTFEPPVLYYSYGQADQQNTQISNIKFSFTDYEELSSPMGSKVIDAREGLKKVLMFCGNKEYNTCDITIFNPEINISYEKQDDKRAKITWTTKHMKECTLKKEDSDWQKTGVQGDVFTDPIHRKTVFTLTCISKAGHTYKEDITIR